MYIDIYNVLKWVNTQSSHFSQHTAVPAPTFLLSRVILTDSLVNWGHQRRETPTGSSGGLCTGSCAFSLWSPSSGKAGRAAGRCKGAAEEMVLPRWGNTTMITLQM